jgi:hypothetical protein
LSQTIRICNCHSCGLPSWACSRGFTTKISIKAANGYQRDRSATIWCCSRLCALISHAFEQMGSGSHKWPISLKEYIDRNGRSLDLQEVGTASISATNANDDLNVTENASKSTTGAHYSPNGEPTEPDVKSVTSPNQ